MANCDLSELPLNVCLGSRKRTYAGWHSDGSSSPVAVIPLWSDLSSFRTCPCSDAKPRLRLQLWRRGHAHPLVADDGKRWHSSGGVFLERKRWGGGGYALVYLPIFCW